MNLQIRQAERKQAKLRIGIFGPSGAGKTYSSLQLAYGITGDWTKIAVIDTENKSADLYSHLGPYNVITLDGNFAPENYIEAIKFAETAGMDVIIIDSITHEWAGPGGILELADKLGKDAKNSYMIWNKLTPRHNAFINAILFSSAHVIACGRSKQDYALNEIEKNGKKITVPEKIGLKSITREGFDYEMTVSFDLGITHYAVSTKDRTGLFQDKPEDIITHETGAKLKEWNESGAPDPVAQKREIGTQLKRLGITPTDKRIPEAIKKTLGIEPIEANYQVIIDGLKKLDKLELPEEPKDDQTPPQDPPQTQNPGPGAPETPNPTPSPQPTPEKDLEGPPTSINEADGTDQDPGSWEPVDGPSGETPQGEETKIEPEKPTDTSGPISKNNLGLLRTLIRQREGIDNDTTIIEWLDFVHDIKVELPENLTANQGKRIIDRLLKQPVREDQKNG